ncbi:MAG: hypothetical protein LQ339_007753 [Xanthoria mediterranea]|nr:MAG: hypothetical protein LQ339_007753 [Xanthoria mediterranea]
MEFESHYGKLKDSEDFWKVAASDHEFWDAYVSTRPNYSEAFYKIIHDYHAAHSSSQDIAHDVGTGAGKVVEELVRHYSHVIASDTDADHLAVAKARLSQHLPDHSRISYSHSKAETLASHHPAASADLIATAECIVLMDRDSGLEQFRHPPQTGRHPRRLCLHSIASWCANWQKFIIRRPGLGASKNAAPDAMACWLDFLPFDSRVWSHVRRYKWNHTAGTLPFFGEEACGYPIEPTSHVRAGEEEEVVVAEDAAFWRNEWDVGALRAYFRVLFPGFREAVGEGDEAIEGLFAGLGRLMGGEGVRRGFTWPCALVLATRR